MVKPTKAMKAMLAKAPGKDPLPLQQAVELLKKFSGRKFDQTIEIHMNLGIDPAQADQHRDQGSRAALVVRRHARPPVATSYNAQS